jgi:hypothetical protein
VAVMDMLSWLPGNKAGRAKVNPRPIIERVLSTRGMNAPAEWVDKVAAQAKEELMTEGASKMVYVIECALQRLGKPLDHPPYHWLGRDSEVAQ